LSTPIQNLGKVAESKVFVLNGEPLKVSYQLDTLNQAEPMVVFYWGQVPRIPVLQDNFSTNLRIGKIRIVKGKPSINKMTGKLEIESAMAVRPSRIVFIPGYDGMARVFENDGTRCYSDPQIADGDINLSNCRTVFGNSIGHPLDATPAYLKNASQTALSWVAEFRASEGGIAPTFEAGEVLAIEFTIQ
jgi:hypothetical protein